VVSCRRRVYWNLAHYRRGHPFDGGVLRRVSLAAGARAASYRAEQNPNNTGDEEYNRYLAILFPSTQLKILDYNRVLKDLNGRTPEQLMNIADAGEIMPPKSTWFEPKLRDGLLVHSLD